MQQFEEQNEMDFQERKITKAILEDQVKRLMREEVFTVNADGRKLYFYYDTSSGRLYFKSHIRGNRVEVINPHETLVAIISGANSHEMYIEDPKFHRKSVIPIHNWKLDENF